MNASRTQWIGICVLALWSGVTAVARQSGSVEITGAVTHPIRLTAADLAALPRQSVTATAHHLSGTWEGVEVRSFSTLVACRRENDDVRVVSAAGRDTNCAS